MDLQYEFLKKWLFQNRNNNIESIKKLCIDAEIGWNLKSNRLHNSDENTNADPKTEAINQLLLERNDKNVNDENNEMGDQINDYQTEDIFHDLLSESVKNRNHN